MTIVYSRTSDIIFKTQKAKMIEKQQEPLKSKSESFFASEETFRPRYTQI